MRSAIATVFSYSLVTKAFVVVSSLVIIRIMSPEQYAAYTYGLAAFSILTGIVTSAFNRIFIIGYSRFNISEDIGAFLLLQLLTLVVVGLLLYLFIDLPGYLYLIVLTLALTFCISDFLMTDYQRMLKFSRYSQVELARSILFVLAILGLIVLYDDDLQAWQVLLLQAMSILIVAVPLLLRRKMLRGASRLSKSLALARAIILGKYRYMFGYLFILALFSQVDIFMLRSLSSEHQLATYGSAYRYYTLLLMALGAVKTVLLPLIQNVSSKLEMRKLFNKHRQLILLTIPIVLLGAVASSWVLPWVDAGKYPNAPVVFQILAVSSLFSFSFSPHVTVVMRFERFFFLFGLICVALVANLALNRYLIPTMGSIGAAWATLLAYGVVNSAIFFYSRRLLDSMPEVLPETVV
jgi:O-antigen/teichoic acid export membrane protein